MRSVGDAAPPLPAILIKGTNALAAVSVHICSCSQECHELHCRVTGKMVTSRLWSVFPSSCSPRHRTESQSSSPPALARLTRESLSRERPQILTSSVIVTPDVGAVFSSTPVVFLLPLRFSCIQDAARLSNYYNGYFERILRLDGYAQGRILRSWRHPSRSSQAPLYPRRQEGAYRDRQDPISQGMLLHSVHFRPLYIDLATCRLTS